MCASMSFATAGMTRSAISTYAPPMGRAFQNLGERTETRANSLATLQQLAEARIEARPSATNGSLPTRSHWSNSGLVDLHSTRAHFDAPMKPATGERTVYVAATNSKSLKSKQADAKSIVQSYVNSLAPEEAPDMQNLKASKNLTASNAGKSVPVRAAAAPVVKNDNSSAELNEKLELMSRALTKLSDQQKISANENKQLQKGYTSLKASNDELNKKNVQLKKQLDILQKETQTSLGFARMVDKNRE